MDEQQLLALKPELDRFLDGQPPRIADILPDDRHRHGIALALAEIGGGREAVGELMMDCGNSGN